jgi:hypothetical protein
MRSLDEGRTSRNPNVPEVSCCHANLRILLPKLPHDFFLLFIFREYRKEAHLPEMSQKKTGAADFRLCHLEG